MIVRVTRGDLVESEHSVAAYACDARGDAVFESGDAGTLVFARSAAKPFIAAAVIAAGAREAFGLETREIAIMAGSHGGEAFHVDAVRALLHKIGEGEEALQCGAHLPYNEAAAQAMLRRGEAPSAIHNNCSGKHAGILALCKLLRADPRTYLDADHPAQREILSFCARLSGDDPKQWYVAVDGCGIPVYATELRRLALSFARLASLQGVDGTAAGALATVREAMIENPEYVAGSGEFDTELMRAGKGTIVSKCGAEGVHGIAFLARGIGYASKVLDGAARARAASSLLALQQIGALEERAMRALDRFAHPVVYNRSGKQVGAIRAIV